MKKLRLIRYLVIVVSSIMFTQCTSDYKVINGLDGDTGPAGIDGIDGIDASAAVCIDCHSDTHREGIYDAYYAITTNHSSGSSWGRGTRESCAACHNNEGFIDYIETGAVAVGDAAGNSYGVSNPISCNGCHSNHSSFDFENDGQDYAVRTLDGVNLLVFAENDAVPDYTIDYGNASNLCANCHQPRRGAPTVDAYPGKYLQTSGHWGPHHGPQTALLEGILGAYSTFTNLVEDIPAVKSASHRNDTGACIDCHMRGTTDGSYGHTWNPAGTNCATCHGDTPYEELEVAGLEEDMATLGALLENVVGQAIDDDDVPIFEADGITPVPQIGIVHFEDGEWHPLTGLFDLKDAEAAWNFLYIYEDKSDGIHNPDYAKSIIKNTIPALQN